MAAFQNELDAWIGQGWLGRLIEICASDDEIEIDRSCQGGHFGRNKELPFKVVAAAIRIIEMDEKPTVFHAFVFTTIPSGNSKSRAP